MNIELFNFEYPDQLIAQHPLPQRDSSRLMVLDPLRQRREHCSFRDITDYFGPDDLVIFNDVHVRPSRLYGRNEVGRRVEVLLLGKWNEHSWRCLLRPARKLEDGETIGFEDRGRPILSGVISGETDQWTITLSTVGARLPRPGGETPPLQDLIEQIALPPLPPYIKRDDPIANKELDRHCYQTIYALNDGAAAAPTAGFHFTHDTLLALKERGVQLAFCTLHVGRDTFQPVRCEQIEDHHMHGENYFINPETADLIHHARAEGRRVTAVGTTVVRALESAWSEPEGMRSGLRCTDAFFYPGYSFKVVDRLLTNFHQPQSTLLMLVSAFAGREFLLESYQEAIQEQYRLFSFGDAMLVLNQTT